MTKLRLRAAGLLVAVLLSVGAVAAAACDTDRPASTAEPGASEATAGGSDPAAEGTSTPAATPTSPEASEASAYRRASAAARAERATEAAAGYGEVRRRASPLAGIAALREAQALVRAGQHALAIDRFEQAAGDALLPHETRTEAATAGGTAASRTGRPDQAIALLERIGRDWPASTAARAAALWSIARVRRDAGDAAWTAGALAVVALSAGAAVAPAALDALEAAGVTAPPLTMALVRYRARQNARADSAYADALAGPLAPHEAAQAWFYRGALAERADRAQPALDAYARSLDYDPAGPLADDALWWRALLLEQSGALDAALTAFDALAQRHPGSPFAADARERAALTAAAAGRPDEAAARLRAITTRGSPADVAEAAYWLGVLGLRAAGDALPAAYDVASYATLLEATPGARLTLPPAAVRERTLARPAGDAGAIATWLSAPGIVPGAGDAEIAVLPELQFARLLGSVGEDEVARAVLNALAPQLRDRPHALLALAASATELGAPDAALFATARVLALLSPAARVRAPGALLALAYPATFAREVLAAADAEGLPPLLLLALVRQESAFHARAGSTAGALGLTQVIPPTGRQLAAALGVAWDEELLYDPATSLRFGARYLADQLRRFDGDVAAALAAYNAGPGAADRWLNAQRFPGADGFIDAIEYAETEQYVARVLEHYAWYRFVYAGAPLPELPRR
ncbi:MAG: lytic transglycosylase domain-containing protein [Dehalococcoidia bacterium]|nr:lytic transglycosylase domain-containing protein [Dehalococcoidia bacterium]